MAIPKIEGKWVGFYSYGKSYPKEFRRKKTSFSLEIVNEDGLIKGICDDEFTLNLFGKPATIEGFAEKYTITFIKRYPSLLTLDENNQPLVVAEEPSLDIQYIGSLQKKIFSNKYILKGSWDISGSFLDKHGNANYYTDEGIWELKPAP